MKRKASQMKITKSNDILTKKRKGRPKKETASSSITQLPTKDVSSLSSPQQTILNDPNNNTTTLKILYENMKANDYSLKPEYTVKQIPKESNESFLISFSKITKFKLISPIEIMYKFHYDIHNKLSLEPDKCSICQYVCYENDEDKTPFESKEKLSYEELLAIVSDVILLDKCVDHFFHIDCIKMLLAGKKSFKCPNCSKIYGILEGDQPNGTMRAYINSKMDCKGYPKKGTIIISYHFPSTKAYNGTSRKCYLPNTKEGREVLGLLKVSFDRKLTFIVGTSVTTGETNTTVWNGVHHKTNTSNGAQYFGYPDPTYFNRVRQELGAKGVDTDNIDEDLENIANNLIKNS